MIKILLLPGSLRNDSASNMIAKTIVALAPAHVSIEVCDAPGNLPHFDDAQESPAAVVEFRSRIRHADGVLFCTPEYAFGIPGTLKNAIDWVVGSGELVHKPVGVVTASSQGEKGHAALSLVLAAVSATVPPGAALLLSAVRSKLDSHGNVRESAVLDQLKSVIDSLCAAIQDAAVKRTGLVGNK